jgi:hypothetical protein
MECREQLVVQKIVAEPDIVDSGWRSAWGEYLHCRSCKSFSLALETWHEHGSTSEFLNGVPAGLEVPA